jgi:hypothetical protein
VRRFSWLDGATIDLGTPELLVNFAIVNVVAVLFQPIDQPDADATCTMSAKNEATVKALWCGPGQQSVQRVRRGHRF